MAIGDGGGLSGLNLSVGIGINLTGQEQLTNIAKALEAINQMVMLTERSFQTLSNTIRNMPTPSTNITRALNQVQQAGTRTSRAPQSPVFTEFGFGGLSDLKMFRAEMANAKFDATHFKTSDGFIANKTYDQAMAANERFDGRKFQDAFALATRNNADKDKIAGNQARARRENERAINDEIAARNRSIENLKSGIIGGLGLTAAMGATELVRTGMHAVGQLDERVAAMRMTGHTQAEIDRDIMAASQSPVHGVNMAERLFLGQEISGILGKEVSPETSRGIAVLARASGRITGQTGDITGVTRNILRTADAFGNVVNPETGQLDQDLLTKNAFAAEKIIAAGQGFVKPETLMHNARVGMQSLQALDIANNPRAMSQFAVMNEDLGERAGDTLNAMRRAATAPVKLNSDQASMMMKFGLFDAHRVEPMMRMPGGQASLMEFGGIAGQGSFLDRLRDAHMSIVSGIQKQHPEFTKQQTAQEVLSVEGKMFGERAARGITDLFSETGMERVAKTQRRIEMLGSSIEDLDKQSQNFNDALIAVKTGFEDAIMAFVHVGGITQMLYGIADALEAIAGFLTAHKEITAVLGEIAAILSTFLALRLGVAGLAGLGRMFGIGGAARAAGVTAGALEGGALAAGETAGLGAAAGVAVTGLSTLNIALLATAAMMVTYFKNRAGQNDLVNAARERGLTQLKPNDKRRAPLRPDATWGEYLDYHANSIFGITSSPQVAPDFINEKTGELKSYGQVVEFDRHLKENRQIIEDAGHTGMKQFAGEEPTMPIPPGTGGTTSTTAGGRTGHHGTRITRSVNDLLPQGSHGCTK